MAAIVTSTEVDRAADEVFAYATDPTRFDEWQRGVVDGRMEQPDHPTVGSRCFTTRRIGGTTSRITYAAAPAAAQTGTATTGCWACMASAVAKAAAADYVKTSTGFGPGGATAADVALMRRVVGEEMGVKAAGGVRDLESLKAMVAAGATRVGASAGVRIVQESRGTQPAAAGKGY